MVDLIEKAVFAFFDSIDASKKALERYIDRTLDRIEKNWYCYLNNK